MSEPRITKELYEESPGPGKSVSRSQEYLDRNLRRFERRSVTGESDYANELYVRFSDDNGRSWGDWIDRYTETYRRRDDLEMIWSPPETGIYNATHDHYVAINLQRIFLGDHHECYQRFWQEGEASWTDHTFLHTTADLDNWKHQLVTYEPGAEFDADNWRNEGYVHVNEAYAGQNLEILPDGDIVFPIGGNVEVCCNILGLDVNEVFPSCPDIMHALIVVRGSWNGESYDLRPSRPVVISDLKSSRGCDEPLVIPLSSGRIVAVFRGSNVISEGWGTRIEAGTPAHKWFCFSDDGGETFSEAVPWHFDNRELFYSPATISRFIRARADGKPYWFGNITGPEAYGNSPRYPLVFAEIDEETGFLKRDTLATVGDIEEGDSEKMQLSNFSILDDRETDRLELYVTKLGANRKDFWRSNAYRFLIEM